MESNGITIGDTLSLDDFFAACDTLQAAGVPAIALGDRDSFAAPHAVREHRCWAVLGPEAYTALWNDPEPVVQRRRHRRPSKSFAKMMDYLNPDHAALTWDGAADLVAAGTAGFTSMGDWAYGQFVAKGTQDAIGWVAHPGTAGSFVTVIDGFTLPVGTPDPVNAANWLRARSARLDAQTAFAPLQGLHPGPDGHRHQQASTIISSGRPPTSRTAAAVPSNAHGAAASPAAPAGHLRRHDLVHRGAGCRDVPGDHSAGRGRRRGRLGDSQTCHVQAGVRSGLKNDRFISTSGEGRPVPLPARLRSAI